VSHPGVAEDTRNDPIIPLERRISTVLRGGVLTSLALIVIGTIMTFLQHPEYLSASGDLSRLTTPGAAVPNSIGLVMDGVRAGQGQAIVGSGLLLLMLTPVARVVVSLAALIRQRDRTYMLLAALVLAMLALSLILGHPGG
jgi:uncharacterized membrane protein